MYLFYADVHTLPFKIQDERELMPWDLRHGMAFYQDAFVSHSDLPVALKYSDSGSTSKPHSHARVGQESR